MKNRIRLTTSFAVSLCLKNVGATSQGAIQAPPSGSRAFGLLTSTFVPSELRLCDSAAAVAAVVGLGQALFDEVFWEKGFLLFSTFIL